MVSDRLHNASRYRSLGHNIARALDFVASTDFAAMPDGRHDIDADTIFALVQRYTTKPLHEGRWEAHRRYIDLQLVVEGAERIGAGHLSQFAAEPYIAERDLIWMTGHGDFVTVPAGGFVLLWPDDVHMPGIAIDTPAPVLKVVVKIAV